MDPYHFGMLDADPHQSGKLDPDQSEKQNPDSDLRHSEKVEALEGHWFILKHWRVQIRGKVSGMIRIRIGVKGRIRIRIGVKGRIRIRIRIKVKSWIRICVTRHTSYLELSMTGSLLGCWKVKSG